MNPQSRLVRCDHFVFAQGINPPNRYMAIRVTPQKMGEIRYRDLQDMSDVRWSDVPTK